METYEGPDHREWSHKKEFMSLALSHLHEMNDSEWLMFREHSKSGDLMLQEPPADLTRAEVVSTSLACASLSVEDISFDCQIIGQIDGHPCFYANGAGYYFWGYPDGGFILEVSVTYPAYPIGW